MSATATLRTAKRWQALRLSTKPRARRWAAARQAERTESTDASLPLQPAEIAILCDGS